MDDEYDDDYDPYEEYERNDPPPARARLYKDHRCFPMADHEKRRNEGKSYRHHRKFVIRHSQEGWKLIDNDAAEGMSVVQCPFCHERMFVGNQVTIE